MIAQYQYDKIYSPEDFSSEGILTTGAVFDSFQKAAVEHAEATGCGFDDMIRQGLIWVVTRLRYQLCGDMLPGEKYVVRTYPFEMKSLLVERDYYIYDSHETVVAKGASTWCLLDSQTRKIVRKPMKFSDEHITVSSFDTPFERIKKSSLDGSYAEQYRIQGSDIDENGHMNNCNYAKLAYRVSGLRDVKNMTIYFEQEAFEGETLSLAITDSEKGRCVFCENEKGQNIFSALLR